MIFVIGVFVLTILFISGPVLGRPAALHEAPPAQLHRAVVRVVARQTAPCMLCANAVTVTVSGTLAASAAPNAVTVSVGSATSTASPSAIGNFGSCSIPQIEFGAGFDGRKETSFRPVDQVSYDHASADNIADIAAFICSTLVNKCTADATAQATCAKAQVAAATATPLEGIDADAFNAVFGIQTNFKSVQAIASDGVPIAGTSDGVASPTATVGAATPTSTSTIGNFGSCSIPEIEFGTGFDGRKETSFQAVNQTSYNHGSAQVISTIAQAICDALTNTCGADATAKATCTKAQTAADAAAPEEGIDADIFNEFFGISTNFAAIPAVDTEGNLVNSTSSTPTTVVAVSVPTTVVATTAAAATTAITTTSSTAASAGTPAASTSNNLQTFTGNLGGVAAPAVVASGSEFQVEGNSIFKTATEALARSCSVQKNDCANAANKSGNKGDFTVAACGTQQSACLAAGGAS